MEYKLLVLDVDGTATNSAKKVTEKTRDAVIRLQERAFRWSLLPDVRPTAYTLWRKR